MKIYSIKKISLILLIPFAFSCKKNDGSDNTEIKNTEIEKNELRYFVDDKEVSKSSIDFDNDDLNLLHGFSKNENEVLVFKNSKSLIKWASENGFEKISRTAADILKLQTIIKKYGTDKFNKRYSNNFEGFNELIRENNLLVQNHSSKNIGFICKGYNGNGGCLPVPPSYPYVGSTFNNKISSVDWVGGVLALCDKAFYSGSKVYIRLLGINDLRVRNFDNKTTSVVSIL